MPPRRNVAGGESSGAVSAEISSEETTKVLKNRPNPSKLRQQKLPAWQPILTAYTAIPTIFVTGMIFIPIGVVLLIYSQKVQEISIDYTDKCSGTQCYLNIQINEFMAGNVYFYYGLDNFFQNHRRYVKSRNDRQLLGDLSAVSDCDPYDYNRTTNLPIAPCGAIANSMFNDTFKFFKNVAGSDVQVPWTYEGVVLDVDRDVKFKNPPMLPGQNICGAFAETSKPPNWAKPACELDLNDPNNNGFLNVDFIVWMRTAALPSFRKLYRILDRNNGTIYRDGLPPGNYAVSIENRYPVSMFNGRKTFVISTTSWSGGKNNFLGIAYIFIGSVCIVLGGVFSFIHIKFGHTYAEMADITTNAR